MDRVRAALLSCPFCGGKATESDCEWGHDLRLFGIKCDACLARSSSYNYPPGDAHGKNVAHEMAIAAWNRRSPLLSGEGLCEQLEQRHGNYDESVLVAPADHDALEAAALICSLTAAKDKAEREREECARHYPSMSQPERAQLRAEYVKHQEGKCWHCRANLNEPPPSRITNLRINWRLFPPNFRKWPIHLHHDHKSGMTIGAVHAYCNAVLWSYHGQ